MPRFRRTRLQKLAGLCLFSAGLLIFGSATSPAATLGLGPREVIRHLYSELLDTMKHAAALGVKGRYDKLRPLIFGVFDVPFMARLTIARYGTDYPRSKSIGQRKPTAATSPQSTPTGSTDMPAKNSRSLATGRSRMAWWSCRKSSNRMGSR